MVELLMQVLTGMFAVQVILFSIFILGIDDKCAANGLNDTEIVNMNTNMMMYIPFNQLLVKDTNNARTFVENTFMQQDYSEFSKQQWNTDHNTVFQKFLDNKNFRRFLYNLNFANHINQMKIIRVSFYHQSTGAIVELTKTSKKCNITYANFNTNNLLPFDKLLVFQKALDGSFQMNNVIQCFRNLDITGKTEDCTYLAQYCFL